MGFRFLLAFTLISFATTSKAVVTITNVGGAAQYSRIIGKIPGDLTTTTTTIIGGVAGITTNCSSPSSSSTCDTCAGGSATLPCNSRAIHDSLEVDVEFTITGNGISGDPGATLGQLAVATNEATPQALDVSKSNTNTNIGDGQYTVSIPWDEICTEVFGASCDAGTFLETSPQVIQIGLDTNNDNIPDDVSSELLFQVVGMDPAGVAQAPCQSADTIPGGACNFIAFPGDEKVFIEDVFAASGFPNAGAGNADIVTIRVFQAEAPNIPTFQSPGPTDLTVSNSDGAASGNAKKITLAKNEVTDLDNEKTYIFTIGSLDEANNLGFVVDLADASISGDITDENNFANCFDTTGAASESKNCFVTSPADVIGLIEENPDCFISSAAYGSPYKSEVKIFRKFRNQFLHPTWLGQKMIRFYYRNSPPLAQWLRDNPRAQPVIRAILFPFWLFASACLQYPILVILSLASLLGLVLFRKRIREVF